MPRSRPVQSFAQSEIQNTLTEPALDRSQPDCMLCWAQAALPVSLLCTESGCSFDEAHERAGPEEPSAEEGLGHVLLTVEVGTLYRCTTPPLEGCCSITCFCTTPCL